MKDELKIKWYHVIKMEEWTVVIIVSCFAIIGIIGCVMAIVEKFR